tara:strand:+ start:155 stop:883 length:729 start_codon:yes stop_codon:yes gene_type:complete
MLEIQKFSKIVVANWKLNGSKSFASNYFGNIQCDKLTNETNCLIICPPAPYIHEINSKNIFKGAQDCSAHIEGAFTGEISARILKDIGCEFCIIGHSERRNLFNEQNDLILKKVNNCINCDIVPILCIGESQIQRKENLTKEILKDQLLKCLPKNINLENIIIAYEPVWSIGTGVTPKVEEISEIHMFIKNEILGKKNVKVLYGGSVKANNYKKLINSTGVDGLLVGGASINLDEFNKIIEF